MSAFINAEGAVPDSLLYGSYGYGGPYAGLYGGHSFHTVDRFGSDSGKDTYLIAHSNSLIYGQWTMVLHDGINIQILQESKKMFLILALGPKNVACLQKLCQNKCRICIHSQPFSH